MKVTNKTGRDLAVTPGHVVPANGSAEISEAVMESLENSAPVRAWFKSGDLSTEKPKPAREKADK